MVNYLCKYFSSINHIVLFYSVSPDITLPTEGETFYTQEGETTTLSCVSTGYPPPVLVWQRNGINLITTNTTEMSTNMGNVTEVTANLAITNINRGYTDNYTCLATNLLDTDTTIIPLIVECKFSAILILHKMMKK